jgi:WD40 repeat protein
MIDQDPSENDKRPDVSSVRAAVRSIPDHELLRCIGRGSYGEVWLARNMMGIYRAIKIVYSNSFSDSRPFERELSGIHKFEPISRSHEGFIDVLHVGINRELGYFYYVMELGDDRFTGQKISPEHYQPKTLGARIVSQQKLSFQECLELGLALSQALAELHKHGLVHRDVKPSNIIFVNGVPKLADIGLVAEVKDDQSYVGTAGFIPPEGPGTAQADIYGLGKVLYEASTGRDRHDFPQLPLELDNCSDRNLFLELNEVVLHACKKNLTQRYQSAWHMHADLLVLANGKSVKRLKVLERRLSNLKRVASVSVLALALVAILCGQIYREWKIADNARQRLVGANVANGNNAMITGDLLGALPYFASALELDEKNPSESMNQRLRLGSVLAQCPKLTQMWFEEKMVDEAEFSPDGTRIVIAQDLGCAKIFDVETGSQYLHSFAQNPKLLMANYNNDGSLIVTTTERGVISVWNSTNLERVQQWQLPQAVLTAEFSPDGTRVLATCNDHSARLLNISTGKVEMKYPHGSEMRFAAFSNDGRLVVTGGTDHRARIWSTLKGELIGKALEHEGWVDAGGFSPDGKRLVTGCGDHKARVWDVATGLQISPDLIHNDAVTSAEFSPDGRLILTSSLDGTVRLWSADTFQPLSPCSVLRYGEKVTHASFDRDGRRIVASCADGSVRIWDLAGSVLSQPYRQNVVSRNGKRSLLISNNVVKIQNIVSGKDSMIRTDNLVKAVSFSGNGAFVTTTSLSKTTEGKTNLIVQTWNSDTGNSLGEPILFTNLLAGTSISDDGGHLISYEDDNAQIWDVQTGWMSSVPIKLENKIEKAFFNPNNSQVATISGSQVNIFNVATGKPSFPPLEHKQSVSDAEFSPDGLRLVSCCTDSSYTKCYAQIWDAVTGSPTEPPLFHNDGVLCATFSPDGTRVATASEDFTAALWDAKNGRRLIGTALQHNEKVNSANFSPDGKWVVTASVDKTARLWDAETGEPLIPPLRSATILVDAVFLANGSQIITFDQQGHARLWQLSVDQRPAKDLSKLSRLLSGDMVASSTDSARQKPELLMKVWRDLKAKYPSEFHTSPEEIIAWHESIFRDSEYAGDWKSAAFHLKRLMVIDPDDKTLSTEYLLAEGRAKKNGNSK